MENSAYILKHLFTFSDFIVKEWKEYVFEFVERKTFDSGKYSTIDYDGFHGWISVGYNRR